MKKNRIITIILCLFLLIGVNPETMAATETEQGSVATCHGIDASEPYLGYGQIIENSQAVFLYERNSNTLMYTQNPDIKIYPSSLVKILTAYLAIENGNLDAVVTVREDVINQVPGEAVTANLLPGEQMSLRDLLNCMMVGSANDAASVIADHIAGSESAFVEMMNAYVNAIGCTDTVIKNPHGLHDEEQISTVRDQARILLSVLENESFCDLFATVSYTVPQTNLSDERELSSSNYLMNKDAYYDSRVTGGRTGIGEDGYRCLATTADSDDMELLCILVGAKSVKDDNGNTVVYGGFHETKALYDAVFNEYKIASVIYAGQPLKQLSVVNGVNDVVIGPMESTNAILPKNVSFGDLTFRYSAVQQNLEAPVDKGVHVSDVEIWCGNMRIAYAELYTMNRVRSVQEINAEQEETEKKEKTNDGSGTGRIVAIVAVCAFSAVVILTIVLRVAVKKKHNSENKKIRRRRPLGRNR